MSERSTFVTTWSSDREDAEHLRDYFVENNFAVIASVVPGPDNVWFVAGWIKSGPAPYCEYGELVDALYVPRIGAHWYGSPYITILCDGGPDVIVGSLIRREYEIYEHDKMLKRDPETFGAATG